MGDDYAGDLGPELTASEVLPTPEHYLRQLGTPAVHQLYVELFHALYLSESATTKVSVTIDRDGTCQIRDNGPQLRAPGATWGVRGAAIREGRPSPSARDAFSLGLIRGWSELVELVSPQQQAAYSNLLRIRIGRTVSQGDHPQFFQIVSALRALAVWRPELRIAVSSWEGNHIDVARSNHTADILAERFAHTYPFSPVCFERQSNEVVLKFAYAKTVQPGFHAATTLNFDDCRSTGTHVRAIVHAIAQKLGFPQNLSTRDLDAALRSRHSTGIALVTFISTPRILERGEQGETVDLKLGEIVYSMAIKCLSS